MTRNARFWVYANGSPVKLTLRADQAFGHTEGGPHEEGYSYCATTWHYDGETVARYVYSWGRDCDGRTSAYEDACCELDKLQSVEPYQDTGFLLPDWQDVDYSQRDYSAEAMGY